MRDPMDEWLADSLDPLSWRELKASQSNAAVVDAKEGLAEDPV